MPPLLLVAYLPIPSRPSTRPPCATWIQVRNASLATCCILAHTKYAKYQTPLRYLDPSTQCLPCYLLHTCPYQVGQVPDPPALHGTKYAAPPLLLAAYLPGPSRPSTNPPPLVGPKVTTPPLLLALYLLVPTRPSTKPPPS